MLIKIFNSHKILENPNETELFVKLIISVANHHQISNFYAKLDKILSYIYEKFPNPISSNYIDWNYNKINRRILYFLFEKKCIQIGHCFKDEFYKRVKKLKTKNSIQAIKDPQIRLFTYLYPIIKNQLDMKWMDFLKKEIFAEFQLKIIQ